MTDFTDLEIKDDKPQPTTWDDLPEQRSGGLGPLLQPGDYIFRLPPADVLKKAWEVYSCKINKTDTEEVQRLRVQFDGECPLVVETDPKGRSNGELWHGRLSTQERNRAKPGAPSAYASDVDFLLRDGLAHQAKPGRQKEIAEALVSHGGELFGATNEWSISCNANKVRYIDNGEGATVEDPSGEKGCGNRAYQRDLARDPSGLYYENQPCQKCGALVRPFQNLGRFRKVAK